MKRQSKVIANFGPLKGMIADLDTNRNAKVKVGVLANKAGRFDILQTKQDGINNPTLGLVHEFGSHSLGIPARSFLRVPLAEELPKKLRQIGEAVWKALLLSKGLFNALEQMGLAGVQVVEGAFRTGGYGRWQPLSAFTIRKKGSSAILIDSGQLRRSISSAVVGGNRP
jgi:hypothetical protein